MGSQKKNRMVRSNLSFPPLNWTFKSGGYVNSELSRKDENLATPLFALTINVITKDKEIVRFAHPTMHPCSSDFELNNWSIVGIPVIHKSSK